MSDTDQTRFRTARLAAGLTQHALARLAGVNYQAVQHHDVKGCRNMGAAERYARHLGVSPQDLLEPSRRES